MEPKTQTILKTCASLLQVNIIYDIFNVIFMSVLLINQTYLKVNFNEYNTDKSVYKAIHVGTKEMKENRKDNIIKYCL